MAILNDEFMKFMKYSEQVPLPIDSSKVRDLIRMFDESCIVIKEQETFLIGRPIISKSNSVSYVFRELDGTERNRTYSSLRQMWAPRNLCPREVFNVHA